jgi:hypothetical protein
MKRRLVIALLATSGVILVPTPQAMALDECHEFQNVTYPVFRPVPWNTSSTQGKVCDTLSVL